MNKNIKRKFIIENINKICKDEKIKILSVLNMYQYEKYLKECCDGIRIDMMIIKDQHINIIYDIINNIINTKKK